MALQNKIDRHQAPARFGAGGVVLLVVLAAFLGFVVWAFFRAWALAGNTTISIHGWIAMGLAAVLTMALGGGLMWLAFYSDRKGYDDPAHHDGEGR